MSSCSTTTCLRLRSSWRPIVSRRWKLAKMNRRSSGVERVSQRALHSEPLLHLVPKALVDLRDLIQVEANPAFLREAEESGEPKDEEAIVMPPH